MAESETLKELIVAKPSGSAWFSGSDLVIGPEIEFTESENQSPLASHIIWITVILQSHLENKANLYKDNSLSRLFLMNNVHYIVHNVKGSPELREMIRNNSLSRQIGKFRRSVTGYERSTWVGVLHCLRDKGIHVSGRLVASRPMSLNLPSESDSGILMPRSMRFSGSRRLGLYQTLSCVRSRGYRFLKSCCQHTYPFWYDSGNI